MHKLFWGTGRPTDIPTCAKQYAPSFFQRGGGHKYVTWYVCKTLMSSFPHMLVLKLWPLTYRPDYKQGSSTHHGFSTIKDYLPTEFEASWNKHSWGNINILYTALNVHILIYTLRRSETALSSLEIAITVYFNSPSVSLLPEGKNNRGKIFAVQSNQPKGIVITCH